MDWLKILSTQITLTGSTRQFLGSNQTRPIVTWQPVSYNCRTGILNQCSPPAAIYLFCWPDPLEKDCTMWVRWWVFIFLRPTQSLSSWGSYLSRLPTHCQQAQSLQSLQQLGCVRASPPSTRQRYFGWRLIKPCLTGSIQWLWLNILAQYVKASQNHCIF